MYPDAFVRCGPGDGDRTVVEDPVVVVEVLSPRTQQADLTRKRWAYQAIETLQAILFVAADEPRVELAVRGADGTWRVSLLHRSGGRSLPLASLAIALPLAELYAGADSDRMPPHESVLRRQRAPATRDPLEVLRTVWGYPPSAACRRR